MYSNGHLMMKEGNVRGRVEKSKKEKKLVVKEGFLRERRTLEEE